MNDDPAGADAPGLTDGSPSPPVAPPRPAPDARDRADYTEFFRGEVHALVAFLITACGASPEDAWDAAQRTLSIMWDKWSGISSDRVVRRAWTRTTARWEYLRLRPDRKYRSSAELPDRPGTELDPEDVVVVEEGTAHARSVLDTLPPTQRLVLGLSLEGYRNAEIARLIDMTEPAVRKNLSRAISTLNAKLKEVPDER